MTQERPTITQAANGFWDGQQGVGSRALPVTRNFIAPVPAEIVQVRRDAPPVPDWLGAPTPAALPVFESQPGARENTSAMDRAQALRVRLLPWVGVWALLSIIVGVVVIRVVGDLPGAGIATLLIFSAMTAFTYYKMDSKDYEYSREGTERHKVDVVHDIALARMDHELEQKRLAFSFYLTLLDRTEKHE